MCCCGSERKTSEGHVQKTPSISQALVINPEIISALKEESISSKEIYLCLNSYWKDSYGNAHARINS